MATSEFLVLVPSELPDVGSPVLQSPEARECLGSDPLGEHMNYLWLFSFLPSQNDAVLFLSDVLVHLGHSFGTPLAVLSTAFHET